MTLRAVAAASVGSIPGLQAALDSKANLGTTPQIAASGAQTAQSANVNAPTFFSVPISGMYRFSAYLVVSRAATTDSVLPGCSVNYTEPTTGLAVQDIVTTTANTNLVGLHTSGSVVIAAQAGANIGYVTTGYTSNGATSMQYAIRVKLEYLGS